MEINDGHYLELMDRLHVVCCTIDEHILNHPLTEVNPDIQTKIENALELLYDAYQDVGHLDANLDDKIYTNSEGELKEINSEPDGIESLIVAMTAQQVYGKYIKPMRDNPDYKLPEKGSILFYVKKHTEGYTIDKITFTSLDEDYCVSLIESTMDSKDFVGWPFGNTNPSN